MSPGPMAAQPLAAWRVEPLNFSGCEPLGLPEISQSPLSLTTKPSAVSRDSWDSPTGPPSVVDRHPDTTE